MQQLANAAMPAPVPPPPPEDDEQPIPGEGVHGGGLMWRFYDGPSLARPLAPIKVNWFIHYFEKRPYGGEAGMWIRVTSKKSKLNWWMRAGA